MVDTLSMEITDNLSIENERNAAKLAYSIREAEYVSSLSRATLYRLIADGKLKSLKIGSKRLISGPSLRGLIAA